MRAKFKITRMTAATAGLALLAGATVAQAADVVYSEPPAPEPAPVDVAPVNTWAGPYAGVSLGYNFSSTSRSSTVGDINTRGWLGGVFMGYNGQSGAAVYGVEGDIGYSGREGTDVTGTKSSAGIDGSLRARLGYAAGPALIYVTGGGAAERHKISDAAGSDTNTMVGWTAGAGVDAMLTDRVFGRVEYRYTDFGNATFNTGSGPQTVGVSTNKISVGVGMKF